MSNLLGTDTNKHGEAAPRVIDLDAGRRAFFKATGMAAASAAVLGAGAVMNGAEAAPLSDTQILNFALNLEYVEAEFYLHATTGTGLSTADSNSSSGSGGEVLAPTTAVPFSDPLVAAYANEIAADELAHVRFLRSALGSAAVSRPKLNIKGAFTKAAIAAGIIQSGQTFDAYANDVNFLLAAYIFEDVGVTAYSGAAPLISNSTYLAAAAGILAVEAYHAGLIRTVLYSKQTSDPSLQIFMNTRKISELRSSLSGPTNGMPDDQGISGNQSTIDGAPRTTSNIVPTDPNAIAFARSVRQVKNIIYGQANADMGLFFPNGVNSGNP